MKSYYVYTMSNASHSLYTGMTSDLERRVHQHKNQLTGGFTERYRFTRLVHYETYEDVAAAIDREKQVKAWRREKKVALIEAAYPEWRDLSEEF